MTGREPRHEQPAASGPLAERTSRSTRASHYDVPFNRPTLVGREIEYLHQAIAGGQLAANGPFTARCERLLAAKTGASQVLLTHSCTAALELAALLCDPEPGDEVVMPSFTFVTTASAFALRGARPVFVDVRPDTLNLDERLVEAALSARTRVLVPVHYAGVACALGPLLALAQNRGLMVVEDAAQALGSTWEGRPLGTVGQLGCWSFHETKNVISGEGGALVVSDPALWKRATILRDKGTDRARFLLGLEDKYSWRDVGSSFAPSELVAAFLLAQLEHAGAILARRRAICRRYAEEFADLAERGLVQLPVVPDGCVANGHLFYLVVDTAERRTGLLAALEVAGVNAVFHYVPLHESTVGQRLGYRLGQLPVTESVSRRLVRLPCFLGLSGTQQQLVTDAVRSFLLGLRLPQRAFVELAGDAPPAPTPAAARSPELTPELSVVSPVFRAEALVPELIRRIRAAVEPLTPDFEIVLVDDGSPDRSWERIADAAASDTRIKGVRLSRNFGQHQALSAGLEVARGRYVVVMDCDLQDDPADIPAFYAKALEGFEIVYGLRRRRAHPALRNFFARAFFALLDGLTPGHSHDPRIGTFSLLGRRAVEGFRRTRQVHRHYLGILDWLGFPAAYVPVEHHPRPAGRSSYSPAKLLRHAVDGIASQSDRLLWLGVGSGFGVLAIALLAAATLVVRYYLHGFKEGWTSVVVLILLATSVVLLSVGVVGIYVGKIFDQVRGRPLYVIHETVNAPPANARARAVPPTDGE